MSDPRGTSHGSRTAAVIMLVVFLQVLIVALLGLGAISRNRQFARERASEQAYGEAKETLEDGLDRAREGVRTALEEIRTRVDSFRALEALREDTLNRRHADLVRTLYQVNPETREVFWIDGQLRLFVPQEVRAEMEASEQERAAVFDSMWSVYVDNQDPGVRVEKGLELIQAFPYREKEQRGRGYVASLGVAVDLIRTAEEEVELASGERKTKASANLERVLLRALEAATLNEDRKEDLHVADRAKLEVIPAEVQSALGYLPLDRGGLRRRHVEAYRDARRQLASGFHNMLELAMPAEVAAEGVHDEPILWQEPYLVGRIRRLHGMGSRRSAVVLLNPAAAQDLVEQSFEPSRLDRLGLAARVVPWKEPAEGDAAVVRDLRQEPGLRLPFRTELYRVRPAPLPTGGPGEFFYWGIIALSAAGLGMGGFVLTRLYTREVRLARLKADFVSNLSHELKTPLTSIGLFTEMLQDGKLTDEEDQKEGLSILAQESERLQSIVGRMLETARREARGVPYELVPGELNGVVGKAAERFRRIATEPGLDLEVSLAPAPLPMLMDEPAIDDVVSNLVSNAWKYRQGEAARIEVRTARIGRKVELTVADDGVGIRRRERRKVFEMFYRADPYLTKVAGTGLGLSLVRTIVRAHNGSIKVETGLGGRGTLFRIRFPYRRAAQPHAAAPSPPRPVSHKSEAEAAL